MINPIILSFSLGFDLAIKIEKSNLVPFFTSSPSLAK
jgi:hypothetical protein